MNGKYGFKIKEDGTMVRLDEEKKPMLYYSYSQVQQENPTLHKLDEQWAELGIDKKMHMYKCMPTDKNFGPDCGGCDWRCVGDLCLHPSMQGGTYSCPMVEGCVIKDLGILNEEGCLPAPWDNDAYPSIQYTGEVEFGWKVCVNRFGIFMCAYGTGTQDAINTWNRRA